jgi:NADPH-dependent glutamate synthase beta subunit-like oxidoreductase/NAD(P)H-flavin reductase
VKLGIEGFSYEDLQSYDGLERLGRELDRFMHRSDAELFEKFAAYRAAVQGGIERGGLTEPDESDILIRAGRQLGVFLAQLFHVQGEAAQLRTRARRDSDVARFKKEFVGKRVAKVQDVVSDEEQLALLGRAVELLMRLCASSACNAGDRELALAMTANRLLDLEKEYPRGAKALAPSMETRTELEQLREHLRTAGAGLFDETVTRREQIASPESVAREAAAVHALADIITAWAAAMWKHGAFDAWTSFRLPKPTHYEHLVETRTSGVAITGPEEHFRRRDAFHLTDPRATPRQIADQANYCIFCHERKKDSCSHGFPEKDGKYKVNPLGIPLEGCPLDEKIGEMNILRADGESIAALAIAMIDNPMCPGTGHRICNDCMKSCIFQKQDPVDIPQIETGTLTDVLFLPWGFEIYALLTRWNPLNARRPQALPYNGRNVLVVGLGPAGYTLAHYLANEGFGVVAIDALKVEPLDPVLVREPIADAHAALWEDLDDRILAGFGGVSEYGITVRWDKNFLKVIRIALERKPNLKIYGGVRFGGTLTIEDAFDELGFDHIAIAAGAGTPTIVRMKNNLIRGIRKASDFLMALQLTGAFKQSSMANLQVRLPALVVGGGLTAIDTATELMAYYPVQVEKILARYETLCAELGEPQVRSGYDAEETLILDELLGHGRTVRDERARAIAAGEAPNFIPLVRAWGGVTIAYRKTLLDSPAYRLNHEEVNKAFEEGIAYAEMLSPIEALADDYGHLKAVLFERQVNEDGRFKDSGQVIELPARTLMVAAGTSPNVIYEKEHPGTFRLDKYNQFFQSFALSVSAEWAPELIEVDGVRERGFFTSYQHPSAREKVISFYGDNHPRYAGNVVKAMASAKDGYPIVADLLARTPAEGTQAERDDRWLALTAMLDDGLMPRVHQVNRLTPTIVEVVVRAPFAARHFLPGQFFRLQNYESLAPVVDGTRLVMEGIALTGAWTDPERGLLSLIILEMGGSSRLCAALEPGEPVVVMGPTGTPTEIPRGETILLAGGGLGNAVLFSIARALKESGCRVVYFAGYKKKEDVFKRDEIEAGTDQVIWSVDAGEAIAPRRPQDRAFVGNIVQSMVAYAQSTPEIAFQDVTRLIAIGSDGMMRAVKDARHGVLSPWLAPGHAGIGSINSPMQCMMKQVCAQCLQRHVDPISGKETFVFSCFNQDQPLDTVDFQNLRARLRQNTVVEKLTNLWLTRLLSRREAAEVVLTA